MDAAPATLDGLTADEAARRLARVGPNVLVPPSRRRRLRRAAQAVADPMALSPWPRSSPS